jgi:Ca2+-binding RTX toxin-like protein
VVEARKVRGGRHDVRGASVSHRDRTAHEGPHGKRHERNGMTTSAASRRIVLLLLAVLVLAAGAGTAQAGTLTHNGSKVFYVADAGETEALVVEATTSLVRIHSSVTIDAPPTGGCEVTAGIGECELEADQIRLDLKDGDDQVTTLTTASLGLGLVPLFVTAGPGDDTIDGSRVQDELYGNDGDDTLRGQGSGDRLEGDRGDDVLDGGTGGDFLEGDEGIHPGGDTLTGGAGLDVFQGGRGNDKLFAVDGVFNETVSCGGGTDFAEIDRLFDAIGQLIADDDASGCEAT